MFNTAPLERRCRDLDELQNVIKSILEQHTFDLREPIVLRNSGSGPALSVVQSGLKQHHILKASDASGRVVQLGFGMGSSGIVASELVPDVNFAIDAVFANAHLSTQGNTPREPEEPGFKLTGVANRETPFVPVTDWARALTSLQKSNDTEHAPDSAVKLTRDGQQYWWATEPWKWQVVRCTVTAINADTLTCSVVAHGNVIAETITVAKPCYLRQSEWDGETVGGVTYDYSDSQHRTADDGSYYDPANEVVYPLYTLDGPCPHIYAAWVGNNTGITDVGWIDLNLDARHWIEAA